MMFVYIHVIRFTVWIASGVEHYPFRLLMMIVSLEAIFLSTFVMISQNRADEKRQVLSLLEAVGTTTEELNGNVKVTLGSETEVLQPPGGKDIDQQMIVDLRRMLMKAGLAPG
jgi:Protein of unknown function (DUF1003)